MVGTALWGGTALWADPLLSWEGRPVYVPGSSFTTVVELEFTAGTWVDVSAYVQNSAELTITRGRNTVLDTAQIGTCSFSLFSNDGRFTPGFNGSPYYPNVIPNKRVRVTVNGSQRFLGFIDKWEPTYPDAGSNNTVVNVTATDRMRLLARNALKSTYVEHVQSLGGNMSVWPCNESAGDEFSDALGVRSEAKLRTPKSFFGSYSNAADGGIRYGDKGYSTKPGLYGTAPSAAGGRVLRLPVIPPATGWSINWWAKPNGVPDIGAGLARYYSGNFITSTGADFSLSHDGTNWRLEHNSGGVTFATFAASPPASDELLMISLVCSSLYLYLFINGAQIGFATLASPVRSTAYPCIGGQWNEGSRGLSFSSPQITPGNVYDTPGGFIGDVVYAPTAMSSSAIADLYTAGLNGFSGESASDRATRIASYAGVSSTSFDSDTLRVGPLNTDGKDSITLGQELATAAFGMWYVDGSGVLRYNNSRQRRATLTPAATFDNEADTTGDSFALPIEEARFYNQVTVTASGGGSFTAIDATSIATIGTIGLSQELNLYSLSQARDRASFWLQMWGTPQPRIASVEVDMMTSSTANIFTTVYALGLDSRIRITGLSPTGPATQVDAFIEGWTESYSMTSARIVFDCSSADSPSPSMVADSSAPYSAAYDLLARLDCDGSQTVNTAMTAVSTTLVANVPGVAFTTTDVPFDVVLDGEILTVTAAAAVSGGLQSLTVTRGAAGTNPVAHAAGTAIYLARQIGLSF